jgi:solute carrier family 8 (sodium/calcium exchanger)
MTFKCQFSGLILPLFGESEKDWPNAIRLILYLMGLCWIFLGVAVISDVFMAGIEKITSAKKRVVDKSSGRTITVYVWNATVANLTLMALGSSAPEILLSLIEITSDEFFLGPLGAGTIVGSAAFNLLIISAVCVCAIPDGEVRFIKEVPVYVITASCSVFAYLWLMFILKFSSPDVCDLWEAVLTLLFCPILVFFAYLADRGYFSKKEGTEYSDCDAPHETIPDDVTDEELAGIERQIRKQHGEHLSQDQIIKIMKVQFFNKRSRAYYRHAAIDAALKGKTNTATPQSAPECAIQEAICTSDDVDTVKAEKTVSMGFNCEKYAFFEDVVMANLCLSRFGPHNCRESVKYMTKPGTATPRNDYEHAEGEVVFEKDEGEKTLELTIKDDEKFEKDEYFTVELSNPVCEEKGYTAQLCKNLDKAQIWIIDNDFPGELRFRAEEEKVTTAACGDTTFHVTVERTKGATGKIGCHYKTESMSAVSGVDFEEATGYVEFDTNIQSRTIPIVIASRSKADEAAFNVVLENSKGCTFDAETDGGEEQCICHVNILPGRSTDSQGNIFQEMKDRVISANMVMGQKNWSQQFHDAIFQIGDDDDDDDEDGDEAGEKSGPSKLDLFIHIMSVPWKLLFAFVPPVDYCGGWACFCGALVFIGVVTAIVGDMANLVGCCLDILPETAAITFVALGTSLPDTFASKAAAMMDPYADASIGNVTGSNSINVFMGIGISWVLAALYWQTSDVTDEWRKRASALTADQQKNVAAASDNGTKAVFIAPGGTIWFNLLIFCVNAAFALQHLLARRRRWGGELGGPKKGFMGQYFSGGFLVCQWFIYVTASIVFARLQDDPVSYGKLAEA